MDQFAILIAIIGMMAVTYLPRLIPILWLADKEIPPALGRWLRQIPLAVLSALLAPSFLATTDPDKTLNRLYLVAAIPTALVAWRSKNLMIAILIGITLIALGRAIGF